MSKKSSPSLVGTWSLVLWEHRTKAKTTYPLGHKPQGLLVYSHDGYMSAILMREGWKDQKLGALLGKSSEEAMAIGSHCFGYSGRYEIDGNEIVHHVAVSLYPNWIGTEQRRLFHLEGDQLELSTRPFFSPHGRATAVLVWKRIAVSSPG